MTTPSFRFLNSETSTGAVSSGEGSTEFYHPILPVTLHPAAGFLVILNGYNLNRIQADFIGYANTSASAVHLLQMRAPRQPIIPMFSAVGTGRLFRRGAKWRYRWIDTRTGEFSGLSPIPDVEYDVGSETPAGGTTFLGQTAYFYLPLADAPPTANAIQLFANSAQEDETWYLADQFEIVSGATYALLTDNTTDDELFAAQYVTTGSPSAQPAGPTWEEGILWPMCRAWQHPSGRTIYFGMRRFGQMGPTSVQVSLTQGSDLVTVGSSTTLQRLIDPGRIGQRIYFSNSILSSPLNDPTVYRIVKVESATTFRVTPEIQVSTDLAEGATSSFYFYIVDDRDARWSAISEPNKPWLLDPLKIMAAGDDYDDGAMAWFSVGGRIFMQTRRRIYEAVGSETDSPSQSTLFIPRVEEGIPGFDAGCETPFGWVYVHEERGPRLFNGAISSPLSGEGDPFGDFQPFDQFQNFEPAMMGAIVCAYDSVNREVIISYVPLGQGTRKETLCFDTTTRQWRGPYRDRVSAAGRIRSTTAEDVFVTGDDFGELMTRNAQTLDVTPTVTGFTGTSTITTWTGTHYLTDSNSSFNQDGDERLRGSPVWITQTSNSTLWFARIADVLSATQVVLDGPPVREDGTAWSSSVVFGAYTVGAIRWSLKTAYIDGTSDPARQVEFYTLNTRYKRGTTNETFEVAASEDANGTFAGERLGAGDEDPPTLDVVGRVHGEFRLKREGLLAQFRLRGLSRAGDPQIARATLIAEERSGATPT